MENVENDSQSHKGQNGMEQRGKESEDRDMEQVVRE